MVKNITADDIMLGSMDCYLGLKYLDLYMGDCCDGEYEHNDCNTTAFNPLTKRELVDDHDVTPEVADKLLAYQSGVINNYRTTIIELLGRIDRYNDLRPFLNRKGLDRGILGQYVTFELSHKEMLKEFNPYTHLRNELVGVSISFSLYIAATAFIWNTRSPTISDFISIGLVTLIWMGITITVARSIPGGYRSRRIIYAILRRLDE